MRCVCPAVRSTENSTDSSRLVSNAHLSSKDDRRPRSLRSVLQYVEAMEPALGAPCGLCKPSAKLSWLLSSEPAVEQVSSTMPAT